MVGEKMELAEMAKVTYLIMAKTISDAWKSLMEFSHKTEKNTFHGFDD